MNINNKGISHILLPIGLLALLVIGVAVYLVMYKDKTPWTSEDSSTLYDSGDEYVQLEEPEDTPEEINNESVEELDTLMQELDNTEVTTEDIESL